MKPIPIFIICRDRLTTLLQLVEYLERSPEARILLVDNGSTYPPLLEYYARTPHEVVRLGVNLGEKAVWKAGLLDRFDVHGRYVVSDPDIVPIEGCPDDAIAYFGELLEYYPQRAKAGFGLKIDDLPEHYQHRAKVVEWESQFWERPLHPRVFDAAIDTTFALYQPWVRTHQLTPALRTGTPYVARHTPWYLDLGARSDEERYYVEHASAGVNSWNTEAFGARMEQLLVARRDPSRVCPPPLATDSPLQEELLAVRALVVAGHLGSGIARMEELVRRAPNASVLAQVLVDMKQLAAVGSR